MKAQVADNFRELCRQYGISARVGYKWLERYRRHGLEGLREQSRRPKSSPKGLGEEAVCRIVRLRQRHPHWGARKLREIYRRAHGQPPSESSVKRVLERCGLVTKRRVRAVPDRGRIASGRRAQGPNEVWTIDFKGSWEDRDGRSEPLTVRDEYSRYVLEVRAMESASTEAVRECMEALFRRYGLPEAIRSDNGTPFASARSIFGLSRLSAWWLALGIDLERGRPSCPQDNGGHERLHLDISQQLERAGYQERQAAFDLWRGEFNHERPHEALGMRMPAEVYKPSERPYRGTPEQLDYPGIESRMVNRTGVIRYQDRPYFLSTALRGWRVGLKPGPNGLLEVRFASLILGHLEAATESFLPASPLPKGARDQGGPATHRPSGAAFSGCAATSGRSATPRRPKVSAAPENAPNPALDNQT